MAASNNTNSEEMSSSEKDYDKQGSPHHCHTDSGFLSEHFGCTTESDLSAAPTSSSGDVYKRLDSGVDVSEHLSLSQLKISNEIDKEEYPPWEYFFTPDADGDTQLHIGVMEGFTDAVHTLLSLIPHPSILDFQNDMCQTALHLSIITKQPRIARRLVTAGARVDMRDKHGNTPLHLAAQLGDLSCVQALTMALSVAELQECQLRYSPVAQTLPQELDLLNFDGQAPIHLAAMGGHVEVIRALHWLGTDLNVCDGKGGRTPLHFAVEKNQARAVECLINECKTNLEVENYGGYTPYQLASESNAALARDLIRMGAIPHEVHMDDSENSDSELDETLCEFSNTASATLCK
jgi:ankyrin only family protein